jgi:hypothetical protein
MSTKTIRDTKHARIARFYERMNSLGFTDTEAWQLRRIEMTLHRWAELECGDGNDYASWSIGRDETTGKPYRCVYPHSGRSYRVAIADRERGALKRLKAIVAARNARQPAVSAVGQDFGLSHDVLAYHQGDPRGCALYLVRANDIPHGASLDSCYTNGFAVCI